MANRYAGKVIVVDTTDTQVGGPNAGIGPKGPLRLRGIYWVATNAAAIADGNYINLDWKDSSGDIAIACDAQLAALTGSMPYKAEFGGKPWIVPGFYVDDITGGELQFLLD